MPNSGSGESSTVNSQINILVLEDNDSDFELLKRELRSVGLDYTVEWAQDKKTFIEALDKFLPDLILLDYSLPGFDGLGALALSHQRFPDVPVIIVSGAIGEELAIETLKAGATDYVLKQRLSRLGLVIHRAMQEAEQRAERKRAEEALRQSEERFRLLVDGVKDYAIFMVDPEGYVTSWNPGAERIKGWAADEILGKYISCFYLPEAVAAGHPQKVLEQASRKGHFEEEGYRVRKNGDVFWADTLITAIYSEVGQLRGFVKVTRDITMHKQLENALCRNSERLKVLSNTASRLLASDKPQEIVEELCDKVMNFLDCHTFFNYLVDEKEGRLHLNACSGIPDESIQGIEWLDYGVAVCGCVAQDGCRIVAENIPETPDPRTELVRSFGIKAYACHPLMAEDQVIGTLSFGTRSRTTFDEDDLAMMKAVADQVAIAMARMKTEEALHKARDELDLRVQERTIELSQAKQELEIMNEELQIELEQHRKLEADLTKAKEAAEAAVEAKAAFLANMSHELRTPMNAVIGFSSLLLEDNLTQEQKEYIEGIRNGGEALLAIISDILEFSRTEKEEVVLELQPLSLKQCIEESLDMVAPQANEKGLNLSYTVGYGTPDTIIGDPGRLRQILVNLLGNAVKFTDKGDVSLSVSSRVIEGYERRILFAVKDTGIGIPQDKMDRLFQPFAQLEYVISRKRDGAGLGLAICKKLVELMNGEIWAESEVGKGSTLRFAIRAEAIPGKQMDLGEKDRSAAYESLSAQNPMAILVAEDNPSNQKALVRTLKRMGYRPDAVADGKEVLQALNLRPYDLIFMDIRMPEMDGLTTTKVIRGLLPENGPKIVAITAYALEGDRERCLEAGMDGYIAKPVLVGKLAEVLKKMSTATRIAPDK